MIKSMISCKDYLEKSPKGNFNCPFCGSGTGPNKSGALQYYPETNTCYCFSCKNESSKGKPFDVIDLEMNKRGCDYNAALSSLADSLSISIDSYSPGLDFILPAQDFTANNQQPATQAPAPQPITQQEPQADYTEYYKVCRKRLQESPEALKYLETRGISAATAAAYWLGYDPTADPATAPGAKDNTNNSHATPRIILPTTPGHYVGRRIDGVQEFAKINSKGSTPGIFNSIIFNNRDQQPAAVFVTEGIFDALSIIEVGAPAIALNSTSNVNKLLNKLEAYPTTATLILSLDNDPAGKKATEELIAGLLRLNIPYITADLLNGYNDPNEALVKDKDKFYAAVSEAQRKTSARPDCSSFYIDHFMQGDIDRFIGSKHNTGFLHLDSESGGISEGLYVIAALSSLGKTTFALQLADQLAAAGTDVLFFSLEQSRLELISKSIARISAQQDMNNALNSMAIRSGCYPDRVQTAAAAYKKIIGNRVSIIEGNFNCDISFIGNYIRQYISKTNTRPVIFIDYLQILQPTMDLATGRKSARETIDSAVTELKRLSRELSTTIFAISSVNRGNYLTPIDFESLKESGGIEFTADVVWGLQLQCLNDEMFNKQENIKGKRDKIKEAKGAEPRKIELVCLKGRGGKSTFSCYFNYYAAKDLYVETDKLEYTANGDTPKAGDKRKK